MEEKVEQLIIPTREIALAVKKDGTIINNLTGMGNLDLKPLLNFFIGLNDFVKNCSEEELVAITVLLLPNLHNVAKNRFKGMKYEK